MFNLFNFDPYCGKRNEELNKGFWKSIFVSLFLGCIFIVAVYSSSSLKFNNIFQNPPSEYEITINGTTEYRTMYENDNVYYGIDKEVAFDASGDVLLIYKDGMCIGKSTDYTIRVAD